MHLLPLSCNKLKVTFENETYNVVGSIKVSLSLSTNCSLSIINADLIFLILSTIIH